MRRTTQVKPGHGPYLAPQQLQQAQPTFHGQQQQHMHAHPAPPHHGGHGGQHAAPQPTATRHLTATTFASLPLSPASQKALHEVLGFTHLTEVQNATLPAVSWRVGQAGERGREWAGGKGGWVLSPRARHLSAACLHAWPAFRGRGTVAGERRATASLRRCWRAATSWRAPRQGQARRWPS